MTAKGWGQIVFPSRGQYPAAEFGGRSFPQTTDTRSLLRYAPVYVLLAAIIADSVQQADTDLWLHVRFGQIVLHTMHLLRHDIFSYSAPGAPWFNHEWLADVVMALFYEAGGVIGLKLMKFVCAAAIMTLLAMGTAESGADYPVQFAALLLAALGLRLQIQFRPQLFDYIILSALLVILARDSRGRSAHLWLAVPMMALWANLHGAFFTGLVVLGVYAAVAGAQDWLAGRGWRRTIHLAALTSAALLATLINPYGIGEWYLVAGKFREPIVALNLVPEFQSFFHRWAAGGSIAMLYGCGFPLAMSAATLITFALAPRRDDFALMAIAAMMICAWLYSMRNMAFAVIACTAPLAGNLAFLTTSASEAVKQPPQEAGARAPARVQLLALAAVAFVVAFGKIFSPRLPTFMGYPVGAVAFMQRNNLSGNILSNYAWGGYLIWHAAPSSKVFFDSFDDRYPQSVEHDYLRFQSGGSAAAEVLKRYPHDYVLVLASSDPYLFMAKRNDWTPIYRDSVCVLFARAGSAAARVSATPHAPPSEFP